LIDLSLVFLTGVLSSLHCIGMCGPIVLAYSIAGNRAGGSRAAAGVLGLHGAYNGGRLISYSVLGAIAGFAGMIFGSLRVIGDYVSLVGGVLLILSGIALLKVIPVPARLTSGLAGTGVAKVHGALLRSRSFRSKLALGLLTPLLPCGVLYAVVVKAAATASVWTGALTMALFALGMAPALVLVGSLSSIFSAKARKSAERLAAVTVILMGIVLLLRGLHVPYLSWLNLGHGGEGACPACGP